MALDFRGIRTEVYARGSDYLDDGGEGETRVKRWVNDAMHTVNGMFPWPFLEATATGAAPLTVTDLSSIRSVTDTDNRTVLVQRSSNEVEDAALSSVSGRPAWFAVTGGDTISVWPDSPVNLSVKYFRVDPDLSADADEPSMPDRFRSCLVELAVAAMLRDDQSPDWTLAQQTGLDLVGRMQEWAAELQPGFTNVPASGDDC